MMWLVKGMVYKYNTNKNMKRVPFKIKIGCKWVIYSILLCKERFTFNNFHWKPV